jgi:hypothetical protein
VFGGSPFASVTYAGLLHVVVPVILPPLNAPVTDGEAELSYLTEGAAELSSLLDGTAELTSITEGVAELE